MLKFFFIAMSVGVAVIASSSDVEVTTSLGVIRGVQLKSRLGEEFNAFRGIRYAKSPEGELRFKNPQPVDPWKPEVYDATADGPRCPQGRFDAPNNNNSEDCLRLNVYSKDLSSNASKPVIVFIHAGGYYGSSGRSNGDAGPQLLMDRDIVLVTINYRLGTLGFLATGTAEAPGNAGLKDQVTALRWVRDHIQNFGGDRNSVTLLGYSAGSMSVGLHLVSPMSKGLFHRGIAMSGSPTFVQKCTEDQLYLAERQAKLLNCPSEDINEIVKFLKKTPFEDFLKTFNKMFDFGYHPMMNWLPVIEKDFGQERFLTQDPVADMEKGNFERVPLIMGMTKDEFARIAYYNLKDENMVKRINENWEEIAPIMLMYRNIKDSKQKSDQLKDGYHIDKHIETNTTHFQAFGKLYSDAIIGFPVHRMINLIEKYTPVHYYCFSYNGRFSDFKYPGDTAYGAVHHDDLLYLLYIPRLAPLFTKSDPENKIVERLTRLWTQFATTGNPNNQKDEYLKNLDWKPFHSDDENYLNIGDELVMEKNLFLERFSVWESTFESKPKDN